MTAVLPELDLEALVDQPLVCSLILMCDDDACNHDGDPLCGLPAVAIIRSLCIDGHSDQDLLCQPCLDDLAVGGIVCWCLAEHATVSVSRL